MPKIFQQKAILQLLKSIENELLILPTPTQIYFGPRTEIGQVRKTEREQSRLRRERYQQIQYLKRKKWVSTKQTEKGLFIKLSDLGKNELIARSAQSKPKLSGNNVCLLIFDFPESARRGRDAFRYFIKSLGFKQVQMSVWESDRNCMEDVKRFIKDTKISKWVKLYIANEK
ncbi:hypothetical protein HYV69_02245 [Candidatus Uhrbacteria bacterium]|nr:hypothetical protein [Candidatus Uhrbacteria bacterium]